MNLREEDKGMALVCAPGGTILRIIRDGLGLPSPLQAGTAIIGLMEADSAAMARDFLTELNERRAAFDCELAMSLGGAARADALRRGNAGWVAVDCGGAKLLRPGAVQPGIDVHQQRASQRLA